MIDKTTVYITTQRGIPLGYQGENETREIVFPQPEELLSENWMLLHQRALDKEPYPVPLDVTALDAALTDVADAIREKGGTTGTITLEEMPGKIAEIQAGGGATEPYVEETYNSDGDLIAAKLVGHTKVRGYAFSNCSKLALTELPAGVTSIGNSAFSNCSKLALTELPAGVTSIRDGAFYSCYKLALTELPAGVTSIRSYAFYGCSNLTSITFKGTCTNIAYNAFDYCTNLTTINVPWAEGAVSNAPWGATNATINYNYNGG